MKPCSWFVAVATCLSALALNVRPIASICQSCQVDSDCIVDSNNTTDVVVTAIEFVICDPETQACVNLDGLRDIDCPCSNGEDCQSGRCEGFFGATCQAKLEDACQAKLEDGQGCNEDSDCVNGNCNVVFICLSRTEEPTSAPTIKAYYPTDDEYNPRGLIAGVIFAVVGVIVFLVVCIFYGNRVGWVCDCGDCICD